MILYGEYDSEWIESVWTPPPHSVVFVESLFHLDTPPSSSVEYNSLSPSIGQFVVYECLTKNLTLGMSFDNNKTFD